MKVTIDHNSGYCFGVEYAVQMAEDEMKGNGQLYCLGDIVHNDMEVRRLQDKGLRVINKDEFKKLSNCKVLIRAHGEPPETYRIALENNIELVDASCPVVLKLQNRVKYAYDQMEALNGQVVIYGKSGHAEVIGLTGQTGKNAIIIASEEDLKKIDFKKPIIFFSQTTKSTEGFYKIKGIIEKRIREENEDPDRLLFETHDSICRQVSNREPNMRKFSTENDVIIFVSGKKSSNGRALFSICKQTNPRSYFVENEKEINEDWFKSEDTVGICGATSTPMWLMEKMAEQIKLIMV